MAYMDNVVPLAMHYEDDIWRRLLKEATSTFTFKVDMLGRESEQYLTDDAYISFKYNDRQYLFNVMTITPDSGNKSIIVYCENLSLELLNETKAPIDVTTSRNLLWYLNNDGLLNNAGLTLGINEVSDKVARIKLESEQTGLARLTSIANNFDAEIEFVTELNGDGTLKSMTVNFFKKYDGVSQGVGTYRRDLILEYGRNVDGIKRSIDKTDLYNAITPTGKDGLNITSLEKEEYDDNGNLEYYTKKGSPNIFAPQSKARYRAQLLNDTDGWLRRYYSADGTSNVNTLYSLALNELKKHAYPAITYEVTGFYDLDIGDTVRIVDHSFTPTLIVQARVAEQSICFSDHTKNKTTFGNILALESRVSKDLTGRLQELVEQAMPYRFEIISDNGLTFKNSTGSTTLTARVYKGSNIDEVSVDSFEWVLDGVKFGGTSKSQLVSASQVTGTAVVRYNAKIGDTVIGGLEVTLQDITDGQPGASGKTYYPHTAYAYSADGTDRFTTVYPNLNLLNGSIQYTKDSPKTLTSNKTDGWQRLDDVYVKNIKAGIYTLNAKTDGVWVNHLSTTDPEKHGVGLWLVSTTGSGYFSLGNTVPKTITVPKDDDYCIRINTYSNGTTNVTQKFWDFKLEKGSTATPWMPSASEVKTSDYPSYIGTYSDTNVNGSIDPGNYTWTVFKGSDGQNGEQGRGVSSVAQKWLVQSSSTKPNYEWTDSRWQATLPAMSVTNKYLYTIERTTYTDATTSDAITLSAVYGDNGSDAWSITMTNDNVTLPANPLGAVTSYTNSNATIGVTYGSGVDLTPVTSTATLANNQYKVTASASGITAGAQSVDATNKKVNFSIASDMSSASGAVASIAYTISVRNGLGVTSTATRVQNFSKAEKGITGDNGIDSYTYFRYSATSNGASMTSLPNSDSKYIGVYTGVQSTAPTTASSYNWSQYRGVDGTNGTNGTNGKDGANGAKGDPTGITKSAKEPTSRFTGMIWYVDSNSDVSNSNMESGTVAKSHATYIWSGTKWSLYILRSVNMQMDNGFITNAMIANAAIDNAKIKDATIESAKIKSINADKVNATTLEALSSKLGSVESGKITNTYKYDSPDGSHSGSIVVENGVLISDEVGNARTTINLVSTSSGQGLEATYYPNKNDITKFQRSWYSPFAIFFNDSVNKWSGSITSENVTLVPWTDLTYLSGYTTAEGNPCQYRKIKNLDGSYTVQFRGQVKPVSGSFPGTNSESNFQIIANLPVDIRPSRHTFLPAVGDMMGTQTIRIGALSDGRIQVGVRGTASSYIGINSLVYTI